MNNGHNHGHTDLIASLEEGTFDIEEWSNGLWNALGTDATRRAALGRAMVWWTVAQQALEQESLGELQRVLNLASGADEELAALVDAALPD